MTSPFKFHPKDVGLETQKIIFEQGDAPQLEIPIPDVVLPEDMTARFRVLYDELVKAGAIPDVPSTFTP